MDRPIARFNERILFQTNALTVDEYGNHLNTWTDYFSCYAYASTYLGDQEQEGTGTREDRSVTFEVRYCSELQNLDSVHFRVIFHGDIYNILSVDMMNYQRRTIRVKGQKNVLLSKSAQ